MPMRCVCAACRQQASQAYLCGRIAGHQQLANALQQLAQLARRALPAAQLRRELPPPPARSGVWWLVARMCGPLRSATRTACLPLLWYIFHQSARVMTLRTVQSQSQAPRSAPSCPRKVRSAPV